MKRSTFSKAQIMYAIRQAESGAPVGDLCRRRGSVTTPSMPEKDAGPFGRERTAPRASASWSKKAVALDQ